MMPSQNVTDFFFPEVDTEACVLSLQALYERVQRSEATLTSEDFLVLLENVGHDNSNVREACLLLVAQSSRVLGRLAALSRLLDDFEPMRCLALEILEYAGDAGDQYAVEQVLENDPAWEVRASAVSCLAGFAGTKAKGAVVRALDDADPGVRRYAAVALARIADAADGAILREAEARESDAGAKTGLYSALYKLGNVEYLPKLLEMITLTSTDPEVVNVSCQVLNGFLDYVFPGDVAFVRAQLAVLDTAAAHPAVRELLLKLQKVLAKIA